MSPEFTPAPDTPDAALHITDAAQLPAAVPYLLGFHPDESVVIVGLHDGEVLVTIRVDLADAIDDDMSSPALADAIGVAARAGVDAMVALVFSDVPVRLRRMPHRAVVNAIGTEAGFYGCALLDVLVVRRDRWWSFVCADLECASCTDEGEPVDRPGSTLAAEATYAGMVALPSRTDVLALLDPMPDRARLEPLVAEHENAMVQAALDGHARRQERGATRAIFAAARAVDAGEGPVSDERAARFGVALSTLPVRDAVWLAVDAGRLGGRELWRDLARRLPEPYDAAPLFLVGWSAWRAGNGVLARAAAERATQSDPGYGAADLLLAAITHGLDPRRMPKLRARSA